MVLWCVDASLGADVTFNATLVGALDPVANNDAYADVWGEGDYAYLGSFTVRGVRIIDISDPTNPMLAATYGDVPTGQFKDVKVHNGIGYFASDSGGGLHVVDLSDPTAPSQLAQITSADQGYNSIHNVSVENGFVYEADSSTNVIKVFDVSTPSSPTFVRDITTLSSSFVHDITVRNGRMYTSAFDGRTDIYDVSNVSDVGWTAASNLLGTVATGNNNHSNWVSDDGNILAIAREINNGDVTLWDVSNPGSPTLLSTINQTSLGIEAISPHNPIIVGDRLYISWYQAGLQVLDISDPGNPQHIAAYDTFPGSSAGFNGNWGVYPFLGPDTILLSDLDGGLLIVSTIPSPTSAAIMALWIGLLTSGRNIRLRR
jgi:choice-of-anchor B domain-containing protein